MKISILLTTYNQEKYILESLYGILKQERKADQVIISDDASTDSTCNIIKNFIKNNKLESKWIFLCSEKNIGIVKNFKKGFKYITGDIFIAMAGDDISLPNRLSISEKIFLDNETISAIATSGYVISERGDVTDKILFKDKRLIKDIKPSIKIGFGGVFPVGLAFKKSILDELSNLSSEVENEDDQLVFLSIINGGILYSSEITFKYRIHSDSASSWLRDYNINKYINKYYKDIPNRISNFNGWIRLMENKGIYHNEIKLTRNKIIAYNQIESKVYKNPLKAILIIIKYWNCICIREKLQIIISPKILFHLRRTKKKLIHFNQN